MHANEYNLPPAPGTPEEDALIDQILDPATPEADADRMFNAWMDKDHEPLLIKWMVYDATRREWCHLDALATPPAVGAPVFRLFWSSKAKRYVTVPGASLYLAQGDGTLALIDDPS